jgi:hypothetical protein
MIEMTIPDKLTAVSKNTDHTLGKKLWENGT